MHVTVGAWCARIRETSQADCASIAMDQPTPMSHCSTGRVWAIGNVTSMHRLSQKHVAASGACVRPVRAYICLCTTEAQQQRDAQRGCISSANGNTQRLATMHMVALITRLLCMHAFYHQRVSCKLECTTPRADRFLYSTVLGFTWLKAVIRLVCLGAVSGWHQNLRAQPTGRIAALEVTTYYYSGLASVDAAEYLQR